jgi:hypothetical protein
MLFTVIYCMCIECSKYTHLENREVGRNVFGDGLILLLAFFLTC